VLDSPLAHASGTITNSVELTTGRRLFYRRGVVVHRVLTRLQVRSDILGHVILPSLSHVRQAVPSVDTLTRVRTAAMTDAALLALKRSSR
jgi:hypothetical protein